MSGVGIVGTLSRDVVAGGPPRVGGAVYYAAQALAALGSDARIATRCTAEDEATLLAPLRHFGLPVAWRPASRGTAFSFHYVGERRVMHVDDIGDPWTPVDVSTWVDEALGGSSWIHVGALLCSDFPAATLQELARADRSLLIDAQGLVRRSRVGPLDLGTTVDRRLLESVTALKLNETEAVALAGSANADSLRSLGVPEVLLTLGSRGSIVVAGERVESIAAPPLEVGVDPTGAGDILAAAYLAGRAEGREPIDAARHASTLAHELLSRR